MNSGADSCLSGITENFSNLELNSVHCHDSSELRPPNHSSMTEQGDATCSTGGTMKVMYAMELR